MKPSSDPLDDSLAAWRLEPPRDPRFSGNVWDRINHGSAAPTWFAYVRSHAVPVAAAFALATALGIFSGRERARAGLAADTGTMANAYVQSLDARSLRLP